MQKKSSTILKHYHTGWRHRGQIHILKNFWTLFVMPELYNMTCYLFISLFQRYHSSTRTKIKSQKKQTDSR